jgi:2-polyprenyl-6-methoxyphenol hydroxylase-like FAD-dependent oxidoreductase
MPAFAAGVPSRTETTRSSLFLLVSSKGEIDRFGGRDHRIDMAELTGGRTITVYGQHEVIKDLISAAIADGQALHFEVGDVSVNDIESDAPTIRYRQDGELRVLQCDVIAGCDGFHGICRPSIPAAAIRSSNFTVCRHPAKARIRRLISMLSPHAHWGRSIATYAARSARTHLCFSFCAAIFARQSAH